jgi:hypothetical protein
MPKVTSSFIAHGIFHEGQHSHERKYGMFDFTNVIATLHDYENEI